ncbi:MAG: cysteine--tRNA ligase, partial [Phaeodactylibacter sp.]|nr:cysteine--tRNA ligase [Phaeodactylibacter sp.]
DVSHLEDDRDDADAQGKLEKQAAAEKLVPMEVAQKYSNSFHAMMRTFNTLEPNIEPRATGHIPEQIEMVQAIIDNGYGYEHDGSVYFDTVKFYENEKIYGELSGRKIEDLISESRDNLKNQDQKRHPSDFAIWIKADEKHIMRWNSPWSVGFPGWHLECSAMSTKYLGKQFDIHGGGNDLKFPHHENEIAQNFGACSCTPAKYWLHTNMLLLNGKKMSKSDGNYIMPDQLFSGKSDKISKAYSPMVVRFFMLQSYYRSTMDLTDEALQAAEKGYKRLMEGNAALQALKHPGKGKAGELDQEIRTLVEAVHAEMDDDFNTPRALARLFELVPKVNSLKGGQLSFEDLTEETLTLLQQTFQDYIFDVLGLLEEGAAGQEGDGHLLSGLMELILSIRQDARTNKDWGTSDKIRDVLNELEIVVKDGKDGSEWTTK